MFISQIPVNQSYFQGVAILKISKSKIIDSPLENRDFHIFFWIFLNF